MTNENNSICDRFDIDLQGLCWKYGGFAGQRGDRALYILKGDRAYLELLWLESLWMPTEETAIQVGRIMAVHGNPGDGVAVSLSNCHSKARCRKQSCVRNDKHDMEPALIRPRSAKNYGIQTHAGNLGPDLNGRMPQRSRGRLQDMGRGVT